jgi:O-acetyl-ADP-ribose deacetylase
MPFHLIRQDITKMDVDVVVNAANEQLQPGGGVCGAIYKAAGYRELQEATNQIGHCSVGQTVVTPAFQLQAKYIFHTVGPIWQGGIQNESEKLASCYETALQTAHALQCESIAFPLISSGIYGYPKDQAYEIARRTIQAFLQTHELTVYLVLFDRASIFGATSWKDELLEYIDDYYVSEAKKESYNAKRFRSPLVEVKMDEPIEYSVQAEEHYTIDLEKLEDTFQQRLFRWIDVKQLNEVDVYKKANITRKHFSKISSNVDYQPKKSTAIALAIALELSIDDTLDLLRCAGYTLSPSKRFDLIIRHFIEREIYSTFTINEALFEFGEELLN